VSDGKDETTVKAYNIKYACNFEESIRNYKKIIKSIVIIT
jgi:hypothetical protein